MSVHRKLLLFIFFTATLFLGNTFAAINYNITPIKYELELQPGESITLPASIRNNGPDTVTLPTTASDFQSNGTSGVPSMVRKSELVYPDQQLSTWISIDDSTVTMGPGQEITTNFTISVPTTATPGGHYGAVLFKNAGAETATSGNIDINVDYGIIILVNVEGEIIVEIEIEDPVIETTGGGGGYTWSGDQGLFDNGIFSYESSNNSWYVGNDDTGQAVYQNVDDCPLGDFTTSKYDNKCFGFSDPLLFSDDTQQLATGDEESPENTVTAVSPSNVVSTPNEIDPLLFAGDFNIDFRFPIKNTGNTHIKPTGKVILKDEDGNIIKAVGKEIVANERGAVIGENIVDYIPINDQGGNVLPFSERIFESQWKGFPYKTYDDQGNQVMNYQNPSEYYTAKNKDEAGFLMFWERVTETRQHKTITAEIELIYYDEDGNPIEFTTAKEFPVQYIEQGVTVNPYIILALLLLSTVGLFIWFGARWWLLVCKKSKCWKCNEKIKSHWKTCPHCQAMQNKKKHKAYEEKKEKQIPKKRAVTKKAPVKKSSVKKITTKK